MKSGGKCGVFSFNHLHMRKNASTGLWMIAILPLACAPGLYETLAHCQLNPKTLSLLSFQVGISSLYILFSLPDRTKISANDKVAQNQNWKSRIITHPYICPLIFTFILWQFSNTGLIGSMLLCFLCREIHHRITLWIFRNFSDSFSIGEAILIGQGASLILTLSVKGVLVIPKSYSEYQQVISFIETGVLSAIVLGFVLWQLRRNLTILKLLLIVVWGAVTGIAISSALLREWTPLWLFNLMLSSPSKLALIGWWTNLSICIFFISTIANRFGDVAQTVWRKSYHLMIVLIMVPGIAKDPLFTLLAASGALILFLLLELIRFLDVKPISRFLTDHFDFFLDDKDQGSLILSHIYLIVGLTIPLWLCPCSYTNFVQIDKGSPQHHLRQEGFDPELDLDFGVHVDSLKSQVSPVALYSGVLSVGIGDAFASIGGTYFGVHKWKGTNKSIEGTLCNILSQIITVGIFSLCGLITLTIHTWVKFTFAVILTAIVEAFTNQVDNILLPFLLYTPLMES